MTRDTQNLDEAVEDALEGTLGEQIVSVVQSEDPDESGLIRPFVVVDLRSALRSVRRSDAPVPGIDRAAEAASELTQEGTAGTGTEESDSGRGMLSRLFVVGLVLGVVYALRNRRRSRSRSVDEAAEEAAEGTQTLAERAASTIQQRGEVAASRLEEGTGAIAERIEERGEMTAQQIQERGEQLEEVESRAEETVEEAADGTENETGGSTDEDEE